MTRSSRVWRRRWGGVRHVFGGQDSFEGSVMASVGDSFKGSYMEALRNLRTKFTFKVSFGFLKHLENRLGAGVFEGSYKIF